MKHLIEQLESLTEAKMGSGERYTLDESSVRGFGETSDFRGVRNWSRNGMPSNHADPVSPERDASLIAAKLLLKTRTPGVVELRGPGWGELDDIEKRVKEALEFQVRQEGIIVRDALVFKGDLEGSRLLGAMTAIYKALDPVSREIKGVRATVRKGREPMIIVSAPRLNAQAAKYDDKRSDIYNKWTMED